MSNLDAASLFSARGLVAVVTGASSGLGAVMARTLDANGASKVFILGRREANLKKLASESVGIDVRVPSLPLTRLGEERVSNPNRLRCGLEGVFASGRRIHLEADPVHQSPDSQLRISRRDHKHGASNGRADRQRDPERTLG